MEIKRYLPQKILYRVKAEENKKTIAQKFNTSILNIKGESFEEGDFVEVVDASENVYVVKPLETLKGISEKLKIPEDELSKLNNLKSKVLFIGQRLRF